MAKVRLEGVRKIYPDGGHVAVHGVDLEVADGEFVVLVGPSGCGKSTTLRMIAGLESITAGRLYIGDRLVNDVPPKERDIAMVFQNYALYPHMSVRENLAFALKLRRLAATEIDTRVRRAAETLGLMDVLDRKPRQLSGGQRQRVAVGRAIVREPEVFLFDEPLSNLDAKLRVQTRREIAKLHRELGATMIYVTHDQVEAMTLGDRIVVMNAGRVQQVDSPLALYDRPANRFVAGFIGSPAMNFVEGSVSDDGGSRSFVSADGAIAIPLPDSVVSSAGADAAVVFGIRPEDVDVGSADEARPGSVAARVDLVEPLGNETFVHASVGTHVITARFSGRNLPASGSAVSLRLDPLRAHWFDAGTELSIPG
ncbi:MAG TPA: sn-glycerol-3-phosphate ABC transporter ATP-binding protein UgpC [Gemmatimonadaceae bacterium]|jgi:multiple sugar transport system ATP-binding protein|nr:sn-glycerol-3-phosphate ABC transporter ATP-binding protein UgpC [Gemmatimonadaceae bacterium]